MPSRRLFLLSGLALLAACLPPASARAQQAARDFVAGIYKFYVGNNAEGIPLDSPLIGKILTPGLRKLIDDDAALAEKRNEPPELNGDPFIDAQDWLVTDLNIDVKEQGRAAGARVTFKNAGEDRTVTLTLVKTRAGWRVDDIVGATGSLRAMLGPKSR